MEQKNWFRVRELVGYRTSLTLTPSTYMEIALGGSGHSNLEVSGARKVANTC
ncbi:hypothetical protein [[Micrococcus luteus] ATCC 49442]|uniref:hypothetical protein n=1 Tax=[Micrococcus luteus] ATCC 49442 TaxID=2698727 RepID=UPI0013D908DB|nr:hypothetical protein [[Micrococcus luteus] ATCC 49442]